MPVKATVNGTDIKSAVSGVRSTTNHIRANASALRSGFIDRHTVDRVGGAGTVRSAQTGTFNQMVAAAVTLIIGIYVFSQIASTMPTPDNSGLANATETVKSTTGDAFTLGAVAILVLVAGLILSLISFGGGGGGRR